jgi:hypothetical protein
MPTSILDATKIQARIVIPIVKALERELGKERAHQIVGEAIAASYVDYRERLGYELNEHPRNEGMGEGNQPAFPVEREVLEDTETSFSHDITGCAFADYFRRMGEPEIGALMTCGVDFAAEDRIRPDWEFTRGQTRMRGADTCDFRWRRRAASS